MICSEGILKADLEENLKKVKDDLDTEIDNLKTEIEDAKDKLEEDIGKFKLLRKKNISVKIVMARPPPPMYDLTLNRWGLTPPVLAQNLCVTKATDLKAILLKSL